MTRVTKRRTSGRSAGTSRSARGADFDAVLELGRNILALRNRWPPPTGRWRARSTDPEADLRVTEEHVLAVALRRRVQVVSRPALGEEGVAHPVERQRRVLWPHLTHAVVLLRSRPATVCPRTPSPPAPLVPDHCLVRPVVCP